MTNNPEKAFLVDTNIFITPFKTYYSLDFETYTFWDFLRHNILNGNIILLDLVYFETIKGGGKLKDWIKEFERRTLKYKNDKILAKFGDVMEYIQANEGVLYDHMALEEWSNPNVADGWLIATSLALGHRLVTFEMPDRNLKRLISNNPKIPDVARHFNIKCINIFNMMRELKFKFTKKYR
jgi:hypothetical protein